MRPHVVGKTRFHGRGDTQGLVDAPEVVPHKMKRHGMRVVPHFLSERIGQSRESPHAHSHSQVLPFNIAGADVFRIGPALYPKRFAGRGWATRGAAGSSGKNLRQRRPTTRVPPGKAAVGNRRRDALPALLIVSSGKPTIVNWVSPRARQFNGSAAPPPRCDAPPRPARWRRESWRSLRGRNCWNPRPFAAARGCIQFGNRRLAGIVDQPMVQGQRDGARALSPTRCEARRSNAHPFGVDRPKC